MITLAEHTLELGKLLVNFQSLEFALRAFLSTIERPNDKAAETPAIEDLKEGDEVPEDAFTNYDSLRELLKKYNDAVARSSVGEAIDDDLVTLRDALAHRVWSLEPLPPLRLLKFKKPVESRTEVAYSAVMDEAWFRSNRSRIHAALTRVSEAQERTRRAT